MPPLKHTTPQEKKIRELALVERIDILARLRDARALVLRDAESFDEAVAALEHIGQIVGGEVRNGFGYYAEEIIGLAAQANGADREEIERRFKVVKDARNMAVHDGAWARHLSTRLVEIFLFLEEAITMTMTNVSDLMVRSPTIAEPWQLVAHARKAMLANSFSCLPIQIGDQWKLITDSALMMFLRDGNPSEKEKRRRLSITVETAIREYQLTAITAQCCKPSDTIESISGIMDDCPVLITEQVANKDRIIGILTPFDLL